MTRRKLLILSIIVVPVLILLSSAVGVEEPDPRSKFGLILFAVFTLWIFFGPAIFAKNYAEELGMEGDLWGLMSIFFPLIVPSILAGFSRPALPKLSPETLVQGKTIRDWGFGDPIQSFNTKKFLGMGGKTLILMSKGLIGDDQAITGGIAWEQVKEIHQDIQNQYVNGMLTNRIRQYNLTLSNGDRISINGGYNNIDELGLRLQEQITASLHPLATSALERGECLTFGPIAITRTGISVKGKVLWTEVENNLLWTEVEDISVNSGYLVISRSVENKFDYAVQHSVETTVGLLTRIVGTAQPVLASGCGVQWKKVSARSVPNIFLLIVLSQELKKILTPATNL